MAVEGVLATRLFVHEERHRVFGLQVGGMAWHGALGTSVIVSVFPETGGVRDL